MLEMCESSLVVDVNMVIMLMLTRTDDLVKWSKNYGVIDLREAVVYSLKLLENVC